MVRKLGLQGRKISIRLKGINDHEAVTIPCERVNFEFEVDGQKFGMTGAIAVPELHLPTQTLTGGLVRHIAKTTSVPLQAYSEAQPSILIGQDHWPLIITSETREVAGTALAVSHAPLGWVAHGIIRDTATTFTNMTDVSDKSSITPCLNMSHDNADVLNELVKRYFEIDSLGIREESKPSAKQKRALETLKNTTRRTDSGWETGLLWKDTVAPQIDSRITAIKRLYSLEKKLDRNPEYAALYYEEMNRFISKGFAKKVIDEERARTWYLPHFGVTNPNKPNRVRLVFDAAAKTCGISLNDQLEPGPDMLQPLPGVLIRFREYEVASKADIKDMYLSVGMREADRGALRFLWRDQDRQKSPQVYEMQTLIFGAKSSPCSALYVKDENAKEFAATKPDAAESTQKNSYVDDYLVSRKCATEMNDLVRDVVEINSHAKFAMHGWASNDSNALDNIRGTCDAKNGLQAQICDRGGERMLGLRWDTKSDTLGFNVSFDRIPSYLIDGSRKPTKREFLKVVMSVFDPLGLLCPFTLKSRVIMQEIWRSGVGWDEKLRDEEEAGWAAWVQNLRKVGTCEIPRCLSPIGKPSESAQLHVFCDASLKAYAAVVYIRFNLEDAPAHVAMVMGKSRVAPLKPLSVPRLELQAALLGTRLVEFVATELSINIEQRFLWSDSQTVLRWIKTEPRTKQTFVAHRLGEIGERTQSSEWNWVPSHENPADCATRCSSECFDKPNLWFEGPEFFKFPDSRWPVQKPLVESEKKLIDTMELRKTHVFLATVVHHELPLVIRLLGWPGLLAAARRVQKVVARWRRVTENENEYDCLILAEEYWIRTIQLDCFPSEVHALRKGKGVPKSSFIGKLRPYIDENGVMRAEGRVTQVEGAYFNNNPIILEGKHMATKFLITEHHRRNFHANNETVVNDIRQRFYIIGLRNALKSIVPHCLTCRIRKKRPENPLMASLPAGRLAYKQRPFSHCGVDYFGPMIVKIGRRREKRWGCLFTCLTTRAVHLELANSLTASSTIMALQRLAARRGCPSVVYSDNGTNFRGACKELADAVGMLNKNKQREFALQNGMRWLFNPPDAPHMGGAWERLVRSVKAALNTVLNDQAPAEEVLHTLLLEIEHSINSRPLTHVSADPRDEEALTPNHFLIGASSGEVRLGKVDAQNINPRKQWQIAQAFADSFWRRWLREYVPTLLPREKWIEKKTPMKVGDVVIIVDLQAPRNVWKKGRVTEIYPGANGEVRVAKVITTAGEYVRPIHKLVRLFCVDEVQN